MRPEDMTMDDLVRRANKASLHIGECNALYLAGKAPTTYAHPYVYADLLDFIAEIERRAGKPWLRAIEEWLAQEGR